MKKSLLRELEVAGADKNEAGDLADFGENLKAIRPRGLSADKKAAMLQSIIDEPTNTSKTAWLFQIPLAGSLAAACLVVILGVSLLPGWLNGSDMKQNQPVKTMLEQGAQDNLPGQTSPTEEVLLEQKQEIELPKIEESPQPKPENDTKTDSSDNRRKNKRWWHNPYYDYRWQNYLDNESSGDEKNDNPRETKSENGEDQQLRTNRWWR